MLRWFNCPAGRVEIVQCLEKCPRGRRCLTRPTLVEIGTEREWTGKPSTTQLLNGTIYSYLKLTKDYTIDPKSKAFALLGTRHHQRLEEVAKDLGLVSELKLDGEITGVMDLLEVEDGEVVLSDLKTWGSYRVAKALGLRQVSKKTFFAYPEYADLIDVELQLNHYRVMVERELGIKVDRMQVQVTVRDGDQFIAVNRGIDQTMYLIPVKMMDDEQVIGYFERKKNDLLSALEIGWKEPCDDWESWQGNKCKKYCEVNEYCVRFT